ncbi:accessory gene regulator B family protein [Paenibacillus sp. UMB4589-SE434]|uniref:accessory gene regulator B family protein n=1 Tax=Paenibacillus sp. UMB4589-SE434 TaxID=3046314 RepID=UPI00255022D5|nr:accessory gene regulator B family protein [Paenibacillus sp. UMB4589-SE434]MDK8183476.1 accessory gene regulator B family protein [Paenibacillus sp. UMB4589-SE434]
MQRPRMHPFWQRALLSGGILFITMSLIVVIFSSPYYFLYQLLVWAVISILCGIIFAWHTDPLRNKNEPPSSPHLIRDKKKLQWALIGLLLLSLLTIRYPHHYSWFESGLQWLGVPTVFPFGNGKLILTGLPLLIGLVILIRMLVRSLNRQRFLIGFAAFLTVTTLPNQAVDVYQRYLGTGIYAIQSNKSTLASCRVEQIQSRWVGECTVSVRNYSRQEVTAHILLKREDTDFPYDYSEIDLGSVTFAPHLDEHSTVKVSNLVLPTAPNYSEEVSGPVQTSFSRMTISDGTHLREL